MWRYINDHIHTYLHATRPCAFSNVMWKFFLHYIIIDEGNDDMA